MQDTTLYVIAVVSNPIGYDSRTRLFKEFAERIEGTPGVQLVRVELVSSGKDFQLTDANNSFHIQLRSDHVVWYKENMINVAIRKLPVDWKYMAWIDADLTFFSSTWVEDTKLALQKHKIVQLFDSAEDLDPDGKPMQIVKSFGYMYQQAGMVAPTFDENSKKGGIWTDGIHWHPGYAWAATREAIDGVGMLMDFPIVGSGDHLMTLGIINQVERITSIDFTPGYLKAINDWKDKALAVIQGNLGYVPGTIQHHYHGSKKNRGYNWRTKIIVDNKFDPYTDLMWNIEGMMELVNNSARQEKLKQDLIGYFVSRKEDE
jgi:hypothetical protein